MELSIIIDISPAYSSLQNAFIERANRTLLNLMRSMMNTAGVPQNMWNFASDMGRFVMNHMVNKYINNKTIYENFLNRKPNLGILKVPFSDVYFYNEKRQFKTSNRGEKGTFVGYSNRKDAIKVYVNGHVTLTRNIIILENQFQAIQSKHQQHQHTNHKFTSIHNQPYIVTKRHNLRPSPSKTDHFDYYKISQQPQLGKVNYVKDTDKTICYKLAPHKRAKENYTNADPKQPKSIRAALDVTNIDHLKWKEAAEKELQYMIDSSTLKVVENKEEYYNKNYLHLVWVFSYKEHEARYKARLCANDSKTVVDLLQSSSPTILPSIIKLIFCIAVKYDLPVYTADIQSAFLQCPLEEKDMKFCYAPQYIDKLNINYPEYEKLIKQNKKVIFKIERSLYGLKCASVYFYFLFKKVLNKFNYHEIIEDPCFFIKDYIDTNNKPRRALVAIHVDDLIFAGLDNERESLQEHFIKSKLVATFTPLKLYLGLNCIQDTNGIHISLTEKIDKLAKTYDITSTTHASTPARTDIMKLKPATKEEIIALESNNINYRSIIGMLNWITKTIRVDVCFVSNFLSRFLCTAGKPHYDAALRVIRYLLRTKDSGLLIKKDNLNKMELIIEVDSDWAGCINTRRSTIGILVFLDTTLIEWRCIYGKTIVLSTAEAELIAIKHGTATAIFYRNLLASTGFIQEKPTIIRSDSKAAIAAISKGLMSSKLRHAAISLYFIRQAIENKEVKLSWIPGNENLSDMLTKPVTRPVFEKIIKKLPGFEEAIIKDEK